MRSAHQYRGPTSLPGKAADPGLCGPFYQSWVLFSGSFLSQSTQRIEPWMTAKFSISPWPPLTLPALIKMKGLCLPSLLPGPLLSIAGSFWFWSDHKKQTWVVIPACPKPRGDVTVLPIPVCSVLDPRLPKETLSPQDSDISGML